MQRSETGIDFLAWDETTEGVTYCKESFSMTSSKPHQLRFNYIRLGQ